MPDHRPRRALRLLTSRSRQPKPSDATPTPSLPEPDTQTQNYLLPSESTPRAHSLLSSPETPPPIRTRPCESLPADWCPPATSSENTTRRDRRVGIRFETPSEDQASANHTCVCAHSSPQSVMENSRPGSEPKEQVVPVTPPVQQQLPDALLEELSALRKAQERQAALLESSLASAAANAAHLEAALEALHARAAVRRPGPAESIFFTLLDALVAVLLCVLTWVIAKPTAAVWKLIKKVRGVEEKEDNRRRSFGRRRSWRLSGADLLASDPFLASAAKRLSFTAADLHD